jgi:hypothetical protein
MDYAAREGYKISRLRAKFLAAEKNRELSLEHIEGLVLVPVYVGRRARVFRRHEGLEQGICPSRVLPGGEVFIDRSDDSYRFLFFDWIHMLFSRWKLGLGNLRGKTRYRSWAPP